jgi:hypothetical protein
MGGAWAALEFAWSTLHACKKENWGDQKESLIRLPGHLKKQMR